MCNSWALDLITLMGRPSLTVISVMLFPATAIERSRLSSSSVHKRQLRLVMASVFRPMRLGQASVLRWRLWPTVAGRAQQMIFSVGFSRLNPKPFNIFTCILQLLQPAGRSANPLQTSPLRAKVLHRPVRLLLPLTRLKAKRADLRLIATSGDVSDSAPASTRTTTMTTTLTTIRMAIIRMPPAIHTLTTAVAMWSSDACTLRMAGACNPVKCAVDGAS